MDPIAAIQTYIDAYNAFDVPAMMLVFADDMVFEHVAGGVVVMTLEGKDAFQQQALAAAGYFKTRRQTITAIAAANEVVEVAIDYHAVAATDLPNGIRKGDELQLKGRSIFHFAGNKVIRLTDIS